MMSKSVANSKERDSVNIVDPVSKRTIITLKNPKVPIKPPSKDYEGINLEKILLNFKG